MSGTGDCDGLHSHPADSLSPAHTWGGHFMALKKLAAAAAMLAFATPSPAFDAAETGASTMFYVSIPLDIRLSRKEQQWTAGMQLQGKRDYQAIRIDSTMLNAF